MRRVVQVTDIPKTPKFLVRQDAWLAYGPSFSVRGTRGPQGWFYGIRPTVQPGKAMQTLEIRHRNDIYLLFHRIALCTQDGRTGRAAVQRMRQAMGPWLRLWSADDEGGCKLEMLARN